MSFLKREEGFTLTEIMVALAVLTIIIFAFTTLFTSSFSGIFRAGRKSASLYAAQKEMDHKIAQGTDVSPGEEQEMTPTIIFDQITIDDVSGERLEILYEYEERSGTLVYFLPKLY